jgi:hypothetical protein
LGSVDFTRSYESVNHLLLIQNNFLSMKIVVCLDTNELDGHFFPVLAESSRKPSIHEAVHSAATTTR